ncbi:uncharacterized protein LOC135815031 isoform X2 [Sycon ciliatum]
MKGASPDRASAGKARVLQQGTGDVAFIQSCLPKVPVSYNPDWRWYSSCNLTIHNREAGSVGRELCFSVAQKSKWLGRKKSTEVGVGTLPLSIPLHRLNGVHPVTLFNDLSGKKTQAYHSCILAFSPLNTSAVTGSSSGSKAKGAMQAAAISAGFLLGLRFDTEAELLMWVAAIKDAVSSPIGSSHLPSVFHVTVPRHQVIDAQDALLMLEPVTPYPSKVVLRHAITLDTIYEVELWKVVSIGHRLDVAQLWIEAVPATTKSRDNVMLTVLCNDVPKASEALRQAISPHLMYDETLVEDVSNQLVTYCKRRVQPNSTQNGASSPTLKSSLAAVALSPDRRGSSVSTNSSIFSWKSLPNLQKESINCVYGSIGDTASSGSSEHLPGSVSSNSAALQALKPFAAVPSSVRQADVSQLCLDDRPYDLTPLNPASKYRNMLSQQSTHSLPSTRIISADHRSSSLHDLRSIGVQHRRDKLQAMPKAIDIHNLEVGRLNSRAKLLPGQLDMPGDDLAISTSDRPLTPDLPEYQNVLSDKPLVSMTVGSDRSMPGPDGYSKIPPDQSPANTTTAMDRVRKMEERRQAFKSESSLTHASTLPRSMGRPVQDSVRAGRNELPLPDLNAEYVDMSGSAAGAVVAASGAPVHSARHSVAALSHAASLGQLPLIPRTASSVGGRRPHNESQCRSGTLSSNSDQSLSPTGSDNAFASHYYHDISVQSQKNSTAVSQAQPSIHTAASRSKSTPNAVANKLSAPPEEPKALQRAKKISSRRKEAANAKAPPPPGQAISMEPLMPSTTAPNARPVVTPTMLPADSTYTTTTHVQERRAALKSRSTSDDTLSDVNYARLDLKSAAPAKTGVGKVSPEGTSKSTTENADMNAASVVSSTYDIPPPPVPLSNADSDAASQASSHNTYDVPPHPVPAPRSGESSVPLNSIHEYDVPQKGSSLHVSSNTVSSSTNTSNVPSLAPCPGPVAEDPGTYDVPPHPVPAVRPGDNGPSLNSVPERESLPARNFNDTPDHTMTPVAKDSSSSVSDNNSSSVMSADVPDLSPRSLHAAEGPDTYDVPPRPVPAARPVGSNASLNSQQSDDVPPLPARNYEEVPKSGTSPPTIAQSGSDVSITSSSVESCNAAEGPDTYDVPPCPVPAARPVGSNASLNSQQSDDVPPLPARNYEEVPKSGTSPPTIAQSGSDVSITSSSVESCNASSLPPRPGPDHAESYHVDIRNMLTTVSETESLAECGAGNSYDVPSTLARRPTRKPSYEEVILFADGRGLASSPAVFSTSRDSGSQQDGNGNVDDDEYMSMDSARAAHAKMSVPVPAPRSKLPASSNNDVSTASEADLHQPLLAPQQQPGRPRDNHYIDVKIDMRAGLPRYPARSHVTQQLDEDDQYVNLSTDERTGPPRYMAESQSQTGVYSSQDVLCDSDDDQYVSVESRRLFSETSGAAWANTVDEDCCSLVSTRNVYSSVDELDNTAVVLGNTSLQRGSRPRFLVSRTVTVDDNYMDMSDTLRKKRQQLESTPAQTSVNSSTD